MRRAYHTSKVSTHKRSRFIRGEFEDRNRYFRCWNCGFIIDSTRLSVDPERSGLEYTATYTAGNPILSGDSLLTYVAIDTPSSPTALILDDMLTSVTYLTDENDTIIYFDSQPAIASITEVANTDITPYAVYKAESKSGCPFCGCQNIP